MSWNYRVFRKKIVYPEGITAAPEEEYFYEIKEVYYNDKNEITAHTVEAVDLGASCIEDLQKICQMVLNDIEKSKDDVLEEGQIVFGEMDIGGCLVDEVEKDPQKKILDQNP